MQPKNIMIINIVMIVILEKRCLIHRITEYTYTLTNKGITYCQKIYDNMSFDVKKCLYNFNNKNLISLKSYQIKSLLTFLNLNVYTS